ncbi:hypothetical protein N181_25035 [Sinorhizobium fredii USDA 205]|uniref:Uncharacterized protein n=1 Tax=Rhizobium fredii TaxID=380 RepID=A0A844A9E8_RHIFR|nr:hypothetical protein [Sinorhizobium fredii]ASY73334.1 hypothetical protein SF83666_b66850 [Sinorhizobium fredii CCBAU 83666]KSV83753.1 hypothetical protein N181_25035 [Sinorhizobium fredii USDA 205]MQW96605.1 hypothetical protein [Sinorhizobium fredii]MQX09573.1 hypothetical protein [Sinorhizobium fredii]UTY45459.1 hypothetical protein EPK84_00265 [Sinorhizobium fredii]
MTFFTTSFMSDGPYSASLSQSAQGQLSSSYTNALTEALEDATVADYVGFLANQAGLSIDDALAVKASVIAGDFTLTGLFGAAQSKTGAVDGSSITDPAPKMLVNGVEIDLAAILTGLDTETWSTVQANGKKLDTIYHTREFYTDTQEPADYHAGWADTNQPPSAEPILKELTEDIVASPIDLLATASDPDGGTLSVVTGSLSFSIDGGPESTTPPGYVTILDGVVTVDTSHPDLQPGGAIDLKVGETLSVVVNYMIEDGQGGSTANSLTVQIAGTADVYTATDSFTFQKIGGGEDERSFSGSFTVDPDGFDGIVTVTGDADLNARNESLEGLIDTHSFKFVGAASNSSTTESLNPYSDTVTLSDADFTDGMIAFNGEFSQQVANGSSISVQLEYDYWA